jgi:hypothetical protein
VRCAAFAGSRARADAPPDPPRRRFSSAVASTDVAWRRAARPSRTHPRVIRAGSGGSRAGWARDEMPEEEDRRTRLVSQVMEEQRSRDLEAGRGLAVPKEETAGRRQDRERRGQDRVERPSDVQRPSRGRLAPGSRLGSGASTHSTSRSLDPQGVAPAEDRYRQEGDRLRAPCRDGSTSGAENDRRPPPGSEAHAEANTRRPQKVVCVDPAESLPGGPVAPQAAGTRTSRSHSSGRPRRPGRSRALPSIPSAAPQRARSSSTT